MVTCTYIIQMPWTTALEQGIFVGERDYTPASVEFWVGFSGVLLSFVSIVMVIVTLVFQLYQLKLQSKSLDQVSESNKENFQIAQSDYNAYVLKLVEPPTGFLDFYLTHNQLLNFSKNPILGHFCPVFVPVQEGLILGQTGPYRDVT